MKKVNLLVTLSFVLLGLSTGIFAHTDPKIKIYLNNYTDQYFTTQLVNENCAGGNLPPMINQWEKGLVSTNVHFEKNGSKCKDDTYHRKRNIGFKVTSETGKSFTIYGSDDAGHQLHFKLKHIAGVLKPTAIVSQVKHSGDNWQVVVNILNAQV